MSDASIGRIDALWGVCVYVVDDDPAAFGGDAVGFMHAATRMRARGSVVTQDMP